MKNFQKKADNFVSVHKRKLQFFTMELYKVSNDYSPDLTKETFSLNDASVLNLDVLNQ